MVNLWNDWMKSIKLYVHKICNFAELYITWYTLQKDNYKLTDEVLQSTKTNP